MTIDDHWTTPFYMGVQDWTRKAIHAVGVAQLTFWIPIKKKDYRPCHRRTGQKERINMRVPVRLFWTDDFWKKKKKRLHKDALPSGCKQLTERWLRTKRKQCLRVYLLLLGYFPCSYCLWFFSLSFFINVTLSYAETTPLLLGNAALCWLHSGLAEAGLFPIVAFQLLQSSFKLPVTLLTISSSPMMARTVREPDSTCQKTRGFELQFS